ncbi:MAG TPA: ATP-binding protein, partial [Polyangiaceae bacterium]|nr:ATP-binding protein [Polyangiaceae bacterium]
AMDLHAQLLLREPNLAPRVKESLQEIREEVRSLLRLVLNLLDISKSEEGQLAPRKADVNLIELSQTVLDAMQVKAKAGSVSLASQIGVERVVADPDLLRRVLENLLDNALRHAPENSTVRLTASPREHTVEIRVQDEGPGVADDMREKIFERFVQIESGARIVTRTGRGLGLAFCKLAVEAHGGHIWIEDAHPGAVFGFDLPK